MHPTTRLVVYATLVVVPLGAQGVLDVLDWDKDCADPPIPGERTIPLEDDDDAGPGFLSPFWGLFSSGSSSADGEEKGGEADSPFNGGHGDSAGSGARPATLGHPCGSKCKPSGGFFGPGNYWCCIQTLEPRLHGRGEDPEIVAVADWDYCVPMPMPGDVVDVWDAVPNLEA